MLYTCYLRAQKNQYRVSDFTPPQFGVSGGQGQYLPSGLCSSFEYSRIKNYRLVLASTRLISCETISNFLHCVQSAINCCIQVVYMYVCIRL